MEFYEEKFRRKSRLGLLGLERRMIMDALPVPSATVDINLFPTALTRINQALCEPCINIRVCSFIVCKCLSFRSSCIST